MPRRFPLLQKSIQEKGEYADALNLLGYSNRKLGDKAKAMTYYTKALNMEPNHLGANEYMGELYLEMNDLPKAEERLAVLKNACGDCDEYRRPRGRDRRLQGRARAVVRVRPRTHVFLIRHGKAHWVQVGPCHPRVSISETALLQANSWPSLGMTECGNSGGLRPRQRYFHHRMAIVEEAGHSTASVFPSIDRTCKAL